MVVDSSVVVVEVVVEVEINVFIESLLIDNSWFAYGSGSSIRVVLQIDQRPARWLSPLDFRF